MPHRDKVIIKKEEDFSKIMNDIDWIHLHDMLDNGVIVYKKKTEEIYIGYYNSTVFEVHSRKILEKLIQHPESFKDLNSVDTKPKEVLYDLNSYANEFPKFSNLLVDSFLLRLDITSKITNEYELIEAVDNKLEHLSNSKNFKKSNVLNLIALVGEVLKRKEPRITWDMTLSDYDSTTWNPNLRYKTQQIPLVRYVGDYVFESRFSTLKELVSYILIVITES